MVKNVPYYKKYLNYFINKTFKSVRWGYIIFFITNKCNSKCKHCFNWQKLNKNKDLELSLEEIEKITQKIGKTQVLLLSGGEPFLRKDLFGIISLFIKNNNVKIVTIPTNALLTKRIIEQTKKLAIKFPKVSFVLAISIDSLHKKNDKIRGIEGAFNKSINTLKKIEKLKKQHFNIESFVNTVISNYNYKDIDQIIEYFKNFDIVYHNFELIRGKPKEINCNLPPIEEIKKIHRKFLLSREFYIKKRNKGLSEILEKIATLGATNYVITAKERVLSSKNLPFVCTAGRNIIVIEANGDVKLCELQSKIGNLKEYDYNIERILKSEKAKQKFKQIKNCKCTHICFLNMSIANTKSLFKIPYYYLKYKLKKNV